MIEVMQSLYLAHSKGIDVNMPSLDILLAEIWKKEPTIRIEQCAFNNLVIVANHDNTLRVEGHSLSRVIYTMWLCLYRKELLYV